MSEDQEDGKEEGSQRDQQSLLHIMHRHFLEKCLQQLPKEEVRPSYHLSS